MELFDLHSHVLPRMDDGARDSDTSVAMLRDAAEQGVTLMAATPHYYSNRRSISDFLSAREASFVRMMDKMRKRDVACPAVCLGAEVYLTRGLSVREDLEKLCYEGTNVILIELPYETWGNWVYREVEQLIADRALKVVLAHPERYVAMPWEMKKLYPFFEMKTALQINADEILERRRIVSKLFDSGCPCVIGSDTHDLQDRRNNIKQAAERIEHIYGETFFSKMKNLVEFKWGLRSER